MARTSLALAVLLAGCSTIDRMAESAGTYRPTDKEAERALRETLTVGASHALHDLGRPGGYARDPEARIRGPLAGAMNLAAERAMAGAGPLVQTAIDHLRIVEPRELLYGPPDAATRYFAANALDRLALTLRPHMASALAQSGVADERLVRWATDQALRGLVRKLAAEERRMRSEPAARPTDVTKRVFAAVPPRRG